ncbi:MAG TPA: hypothetical protein VE093_05195 [Polyangiaceae bacterium]|jgi:hypothetical protein|nr:hypothetical protein [Polyangiaceae bacterium]
MTKLSEVTYQTFKTWEGNVRQSLRLASSLEGAAQRCSEMIYNEFRESVVLARFYATIPLGKLPEESRRFAASLASSRGAKERLDDTTMVLTLFGSRGDEPAWNDRRASRGHLAIPLLSAAFIDEIPMVSRLLRDLGVPMDWAGIVSEGIQTDTFGRLGGFFYVEDAAAAVDHRGRKIISAQDFVGAHGVKTVFGTAGTYVLSKWLVTIIVFCRERIERDKAREFMPFANMVTSATADLARQTRLFEG